MSDTPTALDVQYPPPPPDALPAYVPQPRPRPTLPQLSAFHLAVLVVAAVLTNLALRTGVASLSSTLAALVIVGPLLGAVFARTRTATCFAVAAAVFAAWLPLRASSWLTGLNAITVAACLVAAAATVRPIALRLNTQFVGTVVSRIWMARYFGPALAAAVRPLRSMRSNRVVPVLRGLLIACLPVTVLAALLASADAVFAQSFSMNVDPSSFFEHTFLTLFALAGLAGLVAITSEPVDESFANRRPLGATEALVLLVSMGGLYAAFAVVQLLGALGRTEDIVAQQGLTYSEYARSGFFQLLWVAGLTIVLLALVRLLVTDGSSMLHTAVRFVGAAVAVLTTLIVAVAVVRLGLYTDEFGQTTLRWYCTAFAWMLGVLFVVVAVGHLRRAEHLLPTVVMVVVAATLFTVNVLNPEARVAEHNLGRSDAAENLDARYLTRLSADAWPEILEHRSLVESQLVGRQTSIDQLCAVADEPNGYGIFGLNLAHTRLNCDS